MINVLKSLKVLILVGWILTDVIQPMQPTPANTIRTKVQTYRVID